MTDPLLLPAGLVALLAACSAVGLWARYSRRDPVSLVTVLLVLVFVLPSTLVFAPMGAVGSPALLAGLGLAAVWLAAKVTLGNGLDRSVQPMRVAFFVYAWIMLLSYALGQLRPLTELEQSGSARQVILLISLLGIGLLILDGLHSRDRLDALLRRVLLVASVMAAIGVVQFVTGFDPTQYLRLPGLTQNHVEVGVGARSLFNRPWGTAGHPIEFGVVLGALFPLALHYAFAAPAGRPKWLHWGIVLLMAAGVAMSVSRSGVVALAVSMGVLAFAWRPRRLLNMGVGAVAFTAVMWASVPGLIGTIRGMFTNAEHDPSVIARKERVPIVMDYIGQQPWLGHGFGTFSVEEYLLVDNEFFVTAISTGIIGLAAFVGLILTGIVLGLLVRMIAADDETQHLGQAIAGSLAGLLVCLYTFDAFHYRIFTAVMFLLLGVAGVLWRLERPTSVRKALESQRDARRAARARLAAHRVASRLGAAAGASEPAGMRAGPVGDD